MCDILFHWSFQIFIVYKNVKIIRRNIKSIIFAFQHNFTFVCMCIKYLELHVNVIKNTVYI